MIDELYGLWSRLTGSKFRLRTPPKQVTACSSYHSDPESAVTVEEAMNDRVFMDLLLSVGGSEGGVEQLNADYVRILAVGFITGRDYPHKKLPSVGQIVEWIHPDLPETVELQVDGEIGPVNLYVVRTKAGDMEYLALDPSDGTSWRLQAATGASEGDDEEEDSEPWRAK